VPRVEGGGRDALNRMWERRRKQRQRRSFFVVNRPRFGGKVFQLYKRQFRGSARQVPAEIAQDEQDNRPRAFLRVYKYQLVFQFSSQFPFPAADSFASASTIGL